MRIQYSDKEIDIDLRYLESENYGKQVAKDNHIVTIVAKGDFMHHLIEGIVKALKNLQEDNPHLKELP